MKVTVSRDEAGRAPVGALVVALTAGDRLPRGLGELDRSVAERLRAQLRGGFEGKRGQLADFPIEGARADHVVMVGLGEASELTAEVMREAVGRALRVVAERKKQSAALIAPQTSRLAGEALGQAVAEGAILSAYRFDKYKTLQPPAAPPTRLLLLGSEAGDLAALREGVRIGSAIAESTALARDLANEPGSFMTPARLADRARQMARDVGLRSRIFTPADLERREMGGILAVGRGSANPPRMIVLEHGAQARRGAKRGRKRPTVALVGKGITFDTGGISIKPAQNMHEMKGDMSGGAAVIGALRAAALLDLPLRVIGIVCAAENKPDGDAYVPGDIVRTAAGITLEILNTDAEGRVVLSDGLHYAATQYAPDAIIDLATLTGAKIVALGHVCCAVMGNDEALIERVRAAGDRAHERAWPLPLWDEYKELIRGDVGDLKNTGGRDAGSITAAALLSYFVGKSPWAHLDIAGNEQTARDLPYCPRGATGFGVRLLVELLRRWS
jgi:leucyl aminopeptidase